MGKRVNLRFGSGTGKVELLVGTGWSIRCQALEWRRYKVASWRGVERRDRNGSMYSCIFNNARLAELPERLFKQGYSGNSHVGEAVKNTREVIVRPKPMG